MPKSVDVRVEGLNAVLRALRQFPPEAQDELRTEAKAIASQVMAPAYQSAASEVPHWGDILSRNIRAKRDRIPSVSIGGARDKVSGGATATMLRWPTYSGDAGKSTAPFEQTDWIQRAKGYKGEAMSRWGDAIERVVVKWNRGSV